MSQHAVTGAGEPGRRAMSVRHDGAVRTAVLHLPQAVRTGRRLPLVLDLHGSGSGPIEQLAISGLEAAADRHGIAVVAPQGAVRSGAGYAWAVPGTSLPPGAPDDEGFLLLVVETLVATGHVEESQVYVTGMSGGARMACRLVADHAGRFAAVAAVAGLRAGAPSAGDPGRPGPFSLAEPIPLVAFHGTADHVNPYAGGGEAYWGYSVPAALAQWAQANRAQRDPAEAEVSEHVRTIAHEPGPGGADTVLYVVEGGGHTWPGSRATFPAELGPVTAELDATETMCRFFLDHRR